MGRWVKLLGPYWCRTVIGSELLRHAATRVAWAVHFDGGGDMWGHVGTNGNDSAKRSQF